MKMNVSKQQGWVLWAIPVIAVLLFAIYLALVLTFSYSNGERAGYLQKLSRKGWICKTYEGELAMTTVPGVAPVLWSFTVRDEAVAQKINGLMGKHISVTYDEHVGIPTNCFGDTRYFVSKVTVLEK